MENPQIVYIDVLSIFPSVEAAEKFMAETCKVVRYVANLGINQGLDDPPPYASIAEHLLRPAPVSEEIRHLLACAVSYRIRHALDHLAGEA